VTIEDAGWLAAHLRAMVMTRPGAWANSEMTLPQITALHYICAAGPVTLSGLADALGTGPPATCAMVDRLVRAGLVSRMPDPKDRRRIRLNATDAAGPMIGDIDLDTARRLHAVLNGMTAAARRCLSDVLRDTALQVAGHRS
jgi:DNA-binding MarR family transcriptional regulator